MKFVGHNGEIELIDNAVIIKNGKKDVGRTILLSSIVSTTVLKPSIALAGCLFIQVYGERTYQPYHTAANYSTDKNAIMIHGKASYQEALQMKEAIDQAITNPQQPEQQAAPNDLSYVDEIRALKALVDDGIITQEDFEAKKITLLGI